MSNKEFHALTSAAMNMARESAPHRKALAGGMSSAFEHNAQKYVSRFLSNPTDHPAGIRLCGIIGTNIRATHSDSLSLGASMRQLTLKMTGKTEMPLDNDDRVANTLNRIQNQRLDQAAQSLNRLITLAVAKDIPINFHSVADLLFYWGKGDSAGSRMTRRRLLRDYYTNRSTKAVTETEDAEIISINIKEIAAA